MGVGGLSSLGNPPAALSGPQAPPDGGLDQALQVGAMTRRLDYLTAPAVVDHLRRSDAAILPLGPTEAHGLHLPLGTDTLIALATADTKIAL